MPAETLALIENPNLMSDSPDGAKQKVSQLIAAKEVKLREVAKYTGFSEPTISQALSNTYAGDVDKIESAIVRFYRDWLGKKCVVNTQALQRAKMILELTWRRRDMGIIIAPFGWGKSKAATYYCTSNPNAVYLELLSTTTPASLIASIAEALNIKGSLSGGLDDRLRAIIRALQRFPRLIIIDEADNLRPRTLAILKDIHGGEAEGRCGIVLMGKDRLKKVLLSPELGYLNSRIRIKCELDQATLEEVKDIVKMWPVNLDKDDLKKIYQWAMAHHGLRSLVALMANAFTFMQTNKKKVIDSDCIEDGLTLLID